MENHANHFLNQEEFFVKTIDADGNITIKSLDKYKQEKLKITRNKYYKEHKVSVPCACGGKYYPSSKSRHEKNSIKHFNYLNPNEQKPKRTNKPKKDVLINNNIEV
jgi:hypothetical protein